MREILFRGRRLDNGEWIEGAFCGKDCDSPFGELVDKPSIIKYTDPFSGFWFPVDPETVGQFTGVTDRNGKKIFEGDLVVRFDIFGYEDDAGRVNWSDLFCSWFVGDHSMYGISISSYEVIGDAYDRQEQQEESK